MSLSNCVALWSWTVAWVVSWRQDKGHQCKVTWHAARLYAASQFLLQKSRESLHQNLFTAPLQDPFPGLTLLALHRLRGDWHFDLWSIQAEPFNTGTRWSEIYGGHQVVTFSAGQLCPEIEPIKYSAHIILDLNAMTAQSVHWVALPIACASYG